MRNYPINLEELYGDTYRVEVDHDGLQHEQPQFRKEERPWYVFLEGRIANVFPWGAKRMGVSADIGTTFYRRLRKLAALDNSLVIEQDGDDGMNVSFTTDDAEKVFALADIKKALCRPIQDRALSENRGSKTPGKTKGLAAVPARESLQIQKT